MLRTGQLLAPIRDVVAPLRRRDLARRRQPRYQGPRRLPGPDSHRLAATSLSLGYALFLLSLWRPNCWTHVGFVNSVTADVQVDRAGRPVTLACTPGDV